MAYYSYLTIDSNTESNLLLKKYLDEYPELNILDRCLETSEGINAILKFSPDVVFLNLDESTIDSFGLVSELHQYVEELPLMVGISKSRDKAFEAIKHNFFDYWLLPCDELTIRKSVLKLKKQALKTNGPLKLCLKSYRDYHYVSTGDILYLKADNNTTDVYMVDGSKINAYISLKKFEQQLPTNFVRVHQSYMLNTNYVARINYGKSVCSLKGQKLQLPFSKTYRENIDALKFELSKNSISS